MAEVIARRIAEMSVDGTELVEFAFRVFRDQTMPFEDRRWAFEWIAKYGAGLPQANLQISGSVAVGSTRMNLEDYTLEELDGIERIERAAAERKRIAKATDANAPKVIDVVPSSTTP
jgi:hypothetical protein